MCVARLTCKQPICYFFWFFFYFFSQFISKLIIIFANWPKKWFQLNVIWNGCFWLDAVSMEMKCNVFACKNKFKSIFQPKLYFFSLNAENWMKMPKFSFEWDSMLNDDASEHKGRRNVGIRLILSLWTKVVALKKIPALMHIDNAHREERASQRKKKHRIYYLRNDKCGHLPD